ncbi:MAG: hypothetical protein F4017_03660 [Acidimicrobiaceae bacterium]|nr:hypothetical protein [Acidimicrobiaceae bacterium]MYE76224.1 hypothetical protein [Acidimicrobiaceae bacterium]MYH43179.1 hypothetical protein [Acidimicrobiaceae bacterium]MYJ41598.1 hypothetical protein [Acidimicrobiaceae bacterium]MYK73677.1 hypothetical protein [Acidimicrobiaceae bacterium]
MSKTVFGSVEVDTDTYEDWQKSIIYEQKHFADQEADDAVLRRQDVQKLQNELVARIEAGPAAIETFVVTGVLGVADLGAARGSVPELNPLTAGEMSKLPAYAERRIAESLDGSITPSAAAEPAVWALCHAVWMGRDVFGRDLPTVFLYGSKANTQEARVRNFLRRTGGLRPVRGNTSPLTDCPISAAWWRMRLTEQARAHSAGRLEAGAAHELLRSGHVWENVVRMPLRQVTAVCAPSALAAILCALEGLSSAGASIERGHVQAAIRALGQLSYSHSLAATPFSALVEAASEALRNAPDGASAETEDADQDPVGQ